MNNAQRNREFVDIPAMLRWVRNDIRLLRQLVGMFRDYYPALIEDARRDRPARRRGVAESRSASASGG